MENLCLITEIINQSVRRFTFLCFMETHGCRLNMIELHIVFLWQHTFKPCYLYHTQTNSVTNYVISPFYSTPSMLVCVTLPTTCPHARTQFGTINRFKNMQYFC